MRNLILVLGTLSAKQISRILRKQLFSDPSIFFCTALNRLQDSHPQMNMETSLLLIRHSFSLREYLLNLLALFNGENPAAACAIRKDDLPLAPVVLSWCTT